MLAGKDAGGVFETIIAELKIYQTQHTAKETHNNISKRLVNY